VRELGPFARKRKSATPEGEGDNEVAIMPNGQRLWTDLPYLAQAFQDFWMNESTGLSITERESLAVLTAKLCATGVCSVDLSQCALWLFKEALETDRSHASTIGDDDSKDARPSVSDLLPACIVWMDYSNYKLARLSVDNCNPDSGSARDDQVSTSPGPLAVEANITQPGFSVARWLFWRRRLGDMYLSGDPHVAKSARKCFELMMHTGLAIGIKIPGEEKYLERLFEALDKELVARKIQGCVGPEDIEVNPAWANED
jgi:hypothetical protein